MEIAVGSIIIEGTGLDLIGRLMETERIRMVRQRKRLQIERSRIRISICRELEDDGYLRE